MRAVVYSKPTCAFCVRAKALLAEKGADCVEIDVMTNPSALDELRAYWSARGKRATVPLIFIDGEPIGGFEDLVSLPQFA